jgi:hypothetical protein
MAVSPEARTARADGHILSSSRQKSAQKLGTGAPAHVLNDVGRQRTVGASLHDGARIASFRAPCVRVREWP